VASFRVAEDAGVNRMRRVYEDLSILKHFPEFVAGQLAISEDFVKQTGADGLA
jgi:hypothetical protein